MKISILQKERYNYTPQLPPLVEAEVSEIEIKKGDITEPATDQEELKQIFLRSYGYPIITFKKGVASETFLKPLNVGVVLSGGQAPGGHNVISGLFDGLKRGNSDSKLFGFLGGPSGLIENRTIEITKELIDNYRNTGGFDIIGSGRTKIETSEQFDQSLETCKALRLDAVVVIGGDDSNTNAALLAEYFLECNSGISVIGCPKTIDGDLKNDQIEASFGFDTAAKTYAGLIGNIARDAHSAKKYWHFIRLMGRSASHITLECALQTQPNATIISEEVEAMGMSLSQVVDSIVDTVAKRAEKGDNYGIVLLPEGLIEFIPEVGRLIGELNGLIGDGEQSGSPELEKGLKEKQAWLRNILTEESASLLFSLPESIQEELLMERDPHGNVQVSRIETERLLSGMVEEKLKKMKSDGKFSGKFSSLTHFFGYEGRCPFPSNFDASYCYVLGYNAFLLIASGVTGYISSVKNLQKKVTEWEMGGTPLTMMMNIEHRHGSDKPVIKKALVDLNGEPYRYFVSKRGEWAVKTEYLYPGSIQYYGPPLVCDAPTKTLLFEKGNNESK